MLTGAIAIPYAQSPSDKFHYVNGEQDTQIGTVHGIEADKNGLIWLATSTGLYTYNGYSFNLKSIYPDSIKGPEPEITAIKYDSIKNQFWIGDHVGIKIFDIYSENTRSMKINSDFETTNKFHFRNFLLEGKKCWASSFNGMLLCDDEENTCQIFQVQKDRQKILNDPYFNRLNGAIPHDHPDSLWIGALKGIYSFNKKDKNFRQFISTVDQASRGTIVSALVDHHEYLIAGAYAQGLVMIHKLSKKIEQYKIPPTLLLPSKGHPIIRNIVEKNDQEYWICTETGLFTFNVITRQFERYLNAIKPMFNDKVPDCMSIKKDRLDHWWVGFENGLSQWDPTRFIIKSYHVHEIFQDQTTNSILEADMTPDNKIMVAGYQKGIVFYENGTFLKADFNAAQMITSGRRFYNILVLDDENWLLTDDVEMHSFNPRTGKKFKLLDNADYLLSDMHMQLSHHYDKRNKTLWYGRQWGRGIGKINLQDGSSKLYPQTTFIPDSLTTTTGFNHIYSDEKGTVWFTTGAGISAFDPATEKSKLYQVGEESEFTAGIGIAVDEEHKKWFSFVEKGLYVLDEKTDLPVKFEFDRVSEIREIGEIVFDHKGYLWAATNLGLLRLDVHSKSSILFNQLNGLPKNFIYGALIKEINNQYILVKGVDWVGWLDQVNIVDANKYRASPRIESIKIGSDISSSFIHKNEQVQIKYPENALEVQFSALNFKAKNLNRYRFKMDPYNEEWVDLGSRNSVQFSQLPKGNYTLNISSAYGNSDWSKPSKLNIKVIPPWWKTTWAYLGALLGLILIIVGFHRYRANQIRREESIKSKYEVQLAALEMEALRSQMNPHFIFNALNSIKHFILSNDKFLAAEYLSNFSRLVRKILNNSKSAIISLEEELETLSLYLGMEKLRFNSKFDYEISVDKEIDLQDVKIPPLILQPYVENAIWHGLMHKDGKGNLLVKVVQNSDQIICIIEDDGIGRKTANEINTKSTLKKKSFGMQITKTRIDMSNINAKSKVIDLVDSFGAPLGTRVEIHIPNPQNSIT